MKDLKKYFKLVVTAVICFVMHLFPGKRNKETAKIVDFGQAVSRKKSTSVCGNSVYLVGNSSENVENFRYKESRNRLKKVFFWLTGPGDRSEWMHGKGWPYWIERLQKKIHLHKSRLPVRIRQPVEEQMDGLT